MYPDLSPHVATYPAFLIAGVLVGVGVAVWRLRRAGLALAAYVRLEMVLVLAGLLGAKLYSVWERGGAGLWSFGEWTGNYRYPGGIIAVGLVLVLFRRWLLRGVSLGAFGDAVVPATGFAMAVVRLGCFAHGCCFGRETELPWAMAFPAHSPVWNSQLTAGRITQVAMASLPVHPLQLYFALASVAVALLAWRFERYKGYAGQTALIFLALDGLAKLGLETLRGEPMIHLQIVALATAIAAAVVLLIAAILAPRSATAVALSTRDQPTAINVHSVQRN